MHSGRTYTLTDSKADSDHYFKLVRELADRSLELVPDESLLREKIRQISGSKGLSRFLGRSETSVRKIHGELESAFTPFLTGVDEHLRGLSIADRFDPVMRTRRDQYLYYMLEIELTNRINRKSFIRAPWRMALIAHCLRDFRKDCRLEYLDVESRCTHCDPYCHVNLGSELLERFDIHAFVSVSMDHRKLFKQLKKAHPEMGVLGIACIPELVMGLRLCEGLHIPAVGIPLDANRCSRWLGECGETTFNLKELERLIKDQ